MNKNVIAYNEVMRDN